MNVPRFILFACLAAGLTGCVVSTTSPTSNKGVVSVGPGGKKDIDAKTPTGYTHELREDQAYFAHAGAGKPEDGTLKAKSRVGLVEKKDDIARVAIEGEMNTGDLTPLEGGGNFTHKTKEGTSYYTSIVQGRPPDGAFKTPSSVAVTSTNGGVTQISFEVEMPAAVLVPLEAKDK